MSTNVDVKSDMIFLLTTFRSIFLLEAYNIFEYL